MNLTPGDYKVYGDDKIGAMRVTDAGEILGVQGQNGRYNAIPDKVERLSPCQMYDEASFRHVNDSTLKETIDSHIENRQPRWLQNP